MAKLHILSQILSMLLCLRKPSLSLWQIKIFQNLNSFDFHLEVCILSLATSVIYLKLTIFLTLYSKIVIDFLLITFSSGKLLSHVQLFVTPCTAACQSSLPITSSQSLIKLMSIELVMHPSISSSVIPFSFCLQSFPPSGSFPMSQPFASGGQSIGASASILPINIQDWFPLGLAGLISLQSKGLSSIFSSTTVQKHQFFSTQVSLWSNSHIHTWLLEKK